MISFSNRVQRELLLKMLLESRTEIGFALLHKDRAGNAGKNQGISARFAQRPANQDLLDPAG